MKTLNASLPVEFTFAGFNFPKYAWRIPARSLMACRSDEVKTRLARAKDPVTGEYQVKPWPRNGIKGNGDTFFYLESDFMPGLRWDWCDEVQGALIRHTGWFCDDYQDQKIRGLVFRLPNGRGFLAGWSMGEGMASILDASTVYEESTGAAYTANDMAERAADEERESQQKEEALREAREQEDEAEELTAALCSLE